MNDGVEAGPVSTIAAGERVLMAGTDNHNIFRSSDSGKSWQPFPVGSRSIGKVYFDPIAKLFYGISDSALFTAMPTASSWKRLVTLPAQNEVFGNFHQFSADGATLILQNSPSVMVSRDGGQSWKSSTYPTVGLNILSILAVDPCVFTSDMDTPVSVSCDGGMTWKFTGSDSLSRYGYGLARSPGAIVAAAGNGLIRSMDMGKSWVTWAGNLPGENRVWGLQSAGSALYAWEEYKNFYRSSDGGKIWSLLAMPVPSESSNPKGVAELGGLIFGATTHGVMTSSDAGKSWNTLPVGLMKNPIFSLGISKNKFLAYTSQGILASKDSGGTWRLALKSDSAHADALWTAFAGADDYFAAVTKTGIIRVSVDAGTNWSTPASPAEWGPPISALSVVGKDIYVATGAGLWRSADSARTWLKLILPDGRPPHILGSGKRNLVVATDINIYELSTRDAGFAGRTTGINPSQVGGFWTVDDRLFAITNDSSLYRWNTATSIWQPVLGFTGFAYSIIGAGSQMLLATSEGVYISGDSGKSWKLTGPGSLQGKKIRTMVLSGGFAYGGDADGGVWKMRLAFPEAPVGISNSQHQRKKASTWSGAQAFLRRQKLVIDGRRVKPRSGI